MAQIVAKWADDTTRRFGERLDRLNAQFPNVAPRIVNQVGNRAKTQVIRNLTKQTGLPRKTIVKAVGNPAAARPGKLSYEMVTRGGNIRLKYLSPKETRLGVVARPFGKARLFPGTFMMGGAFPNRKLVERFNGHVYRRLNAVGDRITQVRSGMFIPVEMTRGATKAAFLDIAERLLRERINAVLDKLAP